MTKLLSATRAVPTLCAALLLAVGPATDARAATGTFVYDRIDGSHGRFVNPTDFVCYDFDTPALGVDNDTDTAARVFDNYGCAGVSEVVPSHTAITWGRYRAQSVRFGG
ncbi:hypothetical protein [Streptomyces sp. NPDC018031]|uniref:hypothetical protein n=1 Tax=Streptomyces sp. NPDC018031 TaxID=3365033 RepID=UPI0037B17DBA